MRVRKERGEGGDAKREGEELRFLSPSLQFFIFLLAICSYVVN